MDRTSKTFAFLLILTIAMSCLTMLAVQPANAQTIPKPAVPEFFIRYVDTSYDAPASYSIDPTTGQKVLIEPAHHVSNGTIELWITNQPYTYSNGSVFHVFYLVQNKGHFEDKWVFATPTFNKHLLSADSNDEGVFIETTPHQSNSEYTVLSFSGVYPPLYPSYQNYTYHNGSQVDFKVQAVIGHDSQYFVPSPWYQFNPQYTGYNETGIIFDTTSDWSNTQTVTIGQASTSAPPNPTLSPSPTVPELPFVIILSLFAVIPLLTILAKKRNCLKVITRNHIT